MRLFSTGADDSDFEAKGKKEQYDVPLYNRPVDEDNGLICALNLADPMCEPCNPAQLLRGFFFDYLGSSQVLRLSGQWFRLLRACP